MHMSHPRIARRIRPRTGWAVSVALGLTLLVTATPMAGQEAADTRKPAADPTDVESVDAIIAAVYDVISGPAGELRNWERMRSLFVDGARLIPTGMDQTGVRRMQVWSVEDYIERAGPLLEQRGFFEVEVGRVTEQFGNVVHLMSSYESRWREDDPEPFVRGVNSFQLWNDGARWWVVSIMWEDERSAGEIPRRYLGVHDHSTGADHSMHGMKPDADTDAGQGEDAEHEEEAGHDEHAGHD